MRFRETPDVETSLVQICLHWLKRQGLGFEKRFFKTKNTRIDSSGFYEDSIGEDDISITAEDFDHALSSIRPSVSDRDRMRYEKLNKKLGWNIISDKEPDDAGSTSDKND